MVSFGFHSGQSYKAPPIESASLKMKRKQPEESDEELLHVEAMSLTGAIRSKKDVYEFFSFKCQYHLPPFKECSVGKSQRIVLKWLTFEPAFLKGLLKRDKRAYLTGEVRKINVPNFPEVSEASVLVWHFLQLSVKAIWPKVRLTLIHLFFRLKIRQMWESTFRIIKKTSCLAETSCIL